MTEQTQRQKIPQVNLFAPPKQRVVLLPSPRVLQGALVAFVVVLWGSVGAAIALILGWHPRLGLGP